MGVVVMWENNNMAIAHLQQYWEENLKPLFCEDHLSAVQTVRSGENLRYVNLDNAATTKPFKKVLETVVNSFQEYGSVHRSAGSHSKVSTERYEQARETIRLLVNAPDDAYVIFTKNTTDAISMAAHCFAQQSGAVLVSDIEHSANLAPWISAGNKVVQYRMTESRMGRADDVVNEVSQSFDKQKKKGGIKLLAVTGSSNVTGFKPPLSALATIAHKNGAMILVDACQLVQHERVLMVEEREQEPVDLDFIAFSGHKLYAPFGAGALVGPKDFFDSVKPYQVGGGSMAYITKDLNIVRRHTVHDHESGTPNFVGAVAMAEAMTILYTVIGMDKVRAYEHALGERLFAGMQSIPDIRLFVRDGKRSVFPFDVEGVSASLVAEILSREYAVGVRAGNFCVFEFVRNVFGISRNVDEHIAQRVAGGVTRNIPSLVRASLSIYNTPEDVDRCVEGVRAIATNGFSYYAGTPYLRDERTGVWCDPEESCSL